MGTTADKLQYLADTKELIKTAIQGKGQSFSGTETFRDYATKIGNISNACTAVASNILSGKTAYSGGNLITGNIASKGAQTYSPSISTQTIASGQYLSGTQTINPVTGTAGVGDVLSGKTFASGNGVGLTGTMTNRGAVTSTIATQGGQYTVPEGYHNGSGKITASFANLSAGNIKSGVNVGGVVGTLEGVQQRTINISNPYSGFATMNFYVCGGNSSLINLYNSLLNVIPSTIYTYGDILVLYNYHTQGYRSFYFGISSGAVQLERFKTFGQNEQMLSTQILKLTSTTVNLTIAMSEG